MIFCHCARPHITTSTNAKQEAAKPPGGVAAQHNAMKSHHDKRSDEQATLPISKFRALNSSNLKQPYLLTPR